jgi:hypothetical protein
MLKNLNCCCGSKKRAGAGNALENKPFTILFCCYSPLSKTHIKKSQIQCFTLSLTYLLFILHFQF